MKKKVNLETRMTKTEDVLLQLSYFVIRSQEQLIPELKFLSKNLELHVAVEKRIAKAMKRFNDSIDEMNKVLGRIKI